MALLGNYSVLNKSLGRSFGGNSTALASGVGGGATPFLPSNYGKTGAMRNFAWPDMNTDVLELASIPTGYGATGWLMPIQAGNMSSSLNILGVGTLAATGQLGKNASAGLTGSGALAAIGTKIASIVAALAGSGTISNANLKAFLNAVAALTGSGTVSAATLRGRGALASAVTGSGTATGSTLTALGELEAAITSYGTLTPEGLRDAVWNAVASSYNTTGTMGQKLNSAASGGVDYDALATAVWTRTVRLTTDTIPTTAQISEAVWEYAIEAGFTAEQLLRLFGAVLAGTVTGAGTGTETFVGIDGTTDRIVATVDSAGNRSAVVKDGT